MAGWLTQSSAVSAVADDAAANLGPANNGPGFFDSAANATGESLLKGSAAAGQTLLLAGSLIPQAIDLFAGNEIGKGPSATGSYFRAMDDLTGDAIRYWTPDARTTGTAGRVVGGIAEFAAPLLLGGGNPLATAITTSAQATTSVGADLAREGATGAQAGTVAAVQGVANLVGASIAMRGTTALRRAAFGAGSNVAINVPADAVSAAALDGSAQAERFDPFSAESRSIDLVVGALFGVMARPDAPPPKIEHLDAALTLRQVEHAQYDSAPGDIKTPGAARAQMDNMDATTRALLDGTDAPEPKPVAFEVDPVRERASVERAAAIDEEVAGLSSLYDAVIETPIGPADSPSVTLRPDDIEAMLVERGGFKKVNSLVLSAGSGWGMVKVIWSHGEKSKGKPAARVTKADVLALPEVIRDFEPEIIPEPRAGGGEYREWRVNLPDENGNVRQVVFVDKAYEQGGVRRLVSVAVQEKGRPGDGAPSSKKRTGGPDASPGALFEASRGDTGFGVLRRAGQQVPADGSVRPDATPGKAGTEPAVDPLRQVVDQNPDMPVALVDDPDAPDAVRRVTAREALDEIDAQAKIDDELAGGFDAAINCFLNGGS